MTQTQKEQNKNHILNNLNKFIIDGMDNFINLESLENGDIDCIIWKNEVESYEEVWKKVVQTIVKDKDKWELINNEEVMEDIAEAILREKDQWEIIYKTKWFGMVNVKPIAYKHLPTGKEISVSKFSFKQSYFVSGELEWQKGIRGGGCEISRNCRLE